MRRDRLFKSTPFRLALAFAVMFVGAFLVAGIVIYELVSVELRQYQDQSIQQTYAVIANAFGDSDMTDLLDAVATNVRATRHKERVFLVTTPAGRKLGGNIRVRAFPDGWSYTTASNIAIKGDMRYRVYAGNVENTRLVVGQSFREVDRLEEIMLGSFAWASLVVVLLAVAGGFWIANRAQRRFDAVRDTMDRVSHGDLMARIPLFGRDDDIDILARDINTALARLATTVDGMRQVSSDIAHDLKTPLNRLKISIEDALVQHAAGDTVASLLQSAADEADQINETFEALLRIAQIETGARKAHFSRVDLREVLASLSEVYVDVAEDAGQKLIPADDPGKTCIVLGDRELLTQMYVNLIENAIRHCKTGTRIHIGIRLHDGKIVTFVADNGQGIPEEERERVFRRLYRLEVSRTSPGTGLGLSLVKAVADLHEANIRTESTEPGLRISVIFSGLDARSSVKAANFTKP